MSDPTILNALQAARELAAGWQYAGKQWDEAQEVVRLVDAALRAQADAEPAAYSFEAKHIDSAWGPVLTSKAPVEGPYVRNIRPLYAAPAPAEPAAPADEQLWLWRNGDHFLAFRNLYPCYSPNGDPMTLGEPVGRAILKHSYNREGKPNEQQRTDRQSSWGGPDSDLQRRHTAGAGQAHAVGAGASLGYGQHQIAPQGGWSAGDDSAGSQPVPELAGAAGVLAAQRNLAQGVELHAAHPPAALRQQAEPGELPPLPYPAIDSLPLFTHPAYSADQMGAYARLALAQSPLPKERVEKVMALVRNCTAIHRLHVLGHTTDTECSNALAAVRAILEGRQP